MLQEQLYTVEQFERFIAQPEHKALRVELIHGTIVEKAMPTEEHGLIVARLVMWIMALVEQHKLGRVVVETAYRKDTDTLNYRIPDLAFTSREKSLPVTRQGAVPHMPDLAVEVKSPSDTYVEMREKASYYLNNGAQMVWLVFPDVGRVEVHTPGGSVQTLASGEQLSGGAVLPGFTLEVNRIFAL